MSPLVPYRFLVRIAHPCPYLAELPGNDRPDGRLLSLPESGRLRSYADGQDQHLFGDIRMGWNEFGLGITLSVTGKRQPPRGDASRPWTGDGLTLWIDTRDARNSHRASRYCHQFHLLPYSADDSELSATFVQSPINRALQDATQVDPESVLIRSQRTKVGYELQCFLPAAVLTGYDPDQFPRLGIYYHLRDSELGDQFLAVGADFPISDDPTLWESLELIRRDDGRFATSASD